MSSSPTSTVTEPRVTAIGSGLVECADLSVRRAGRTAVAGITLAIGGNECVSLVGPNGSGKTTLLLALLGLLRPSAGAVRWNGQHVADIAPRERGRYAAYVPQNLERVPALRVSDVIAGGRYAHVGPLRALGADDRAAIDAALTRCGLTSLADRRFDAISGGERQKTLLAAAIAQDPQMLFLDEPNTALDPAYQLELVSILRAWHESGCGLLLISHDLQLPSVLGGRVVALRDGRIAADGPAATILTPATLAGIYEARFVEVTTPAGQRVILPEW